MTNLYDAATVGAQRPGRPAPRLLDWRHASVGDPAPCTICGRPALMRHPDTGRPQHKVCAEASLAEQERA